MIEPFEYEPRKLGAKPPTGHVGDAEIGGSASIDQNMKFPVLHDPMEDVKLESKQTRIFQTKIGNPSMQNASQADLVPERLIGQGPLVVSENEPPLAGMSDLTTSQLLSTILDADRYIPATNRHIIPPMKVNALSSPFLEPSLTNAYVHKFSPNLSF